MGGYFLRGLISIKQIGQHVFLNTRSFFYWFNEWVEILKKRGMYKDIVWTDNQQKEFDAFWIKHYGKKISSRWHKHYQSFNGVFCVDYFPEIFYTSFLETKFNKKSYADVFNDKILTEIIYRGRGAAFPVTVAVFDGVNAYDGKRKPLRWSEFIELLSNAGSVVIKPSVGFGSGNGIIFADFQTGKDTRSGMSVSALLKSMVSRQVLVQKVLEQHETYAAVNASSVNSIRITTYLLNGRIFHSPICMRCGTGGNQIDNIHAGGLGIAVDDNGKMNKYAYQLGYSDKCVKYLQHPDSGLIFDGYQLPGIKEMTLCAKRMHTLTPHIGIIAWDFMLDKAGNATVIEANFNGNGIWFPQIIHGKSMFYENMPEIIDFMCRKE